MRSERSAVPAFRLRQGGEGDAGPCAAILQHWLDATPWMPDLHRAEETEWFMRHRLIADNELCVAEGADGVAGYIFVGPTGFVPSLTVADGARGRGLGGALLGWAKGVRPGGLSLWCFVANGGAQRFYLRHGFREVRRTEGENDEGLPDILYRWEGSA